MQTFLQAAAAVLLAVILILSMKGQSKDVGLLLSVFVCCSLGALAMAYLSPVLQFVEQLQSLGALDDEMLSILLKVVGISFVAEVAGLICTDAGNAALGKGLQFLAVAVILWLSLPMLTAVLELVEGILGKV